MTAAEWTAMISAVQHHEFRQQSHSRLHVGLACSSLHFVPSLAACESANGDDDDDD